MADLTLEFKVFVTVDARQIAESYGVRSDTWVKEMVSDILRAVPEFEDVDVRIPEPPKVPFKTSDGSVL